MSESAFSHGRNFSIKETLKNFTSRLKQGENPEIVKKHFKALVKQTSPLELAHWEKELLQEQVPRELLLLLCGWQFDLFSELARH